MGPGIKLSLSELTAGSLTFHGHLAVPVYFYFNVYALEAEFISLPPSLLPTDPSPPPPFLWYPTLVTKSTPDNEGAQWVRVLAAKVNNLSSLWGLHIVK